MRSPIAWCLMLAILAAPGSVSAEEAESILERSPTGSDARARVLQESKFAQSLGMSRARAEEQGLIGRDSQFQALRNVGAVPAPSSVRGLAVPYRDGPFPGWIIEAEEEAKSERRGIWAGEFEAPWEYRKRVRARD